MSTQTDSATIPELQLYNSLSRRKETFQPIETGKVHMYVCGVTVYDDQHVGHGMSAVVFDVMRRYLTHIGYDVKYVQNFTDIDDKIIERAKAEGVSVENLTDHLIASWHEESRALNVLPATVHPRATEEVPEIIAMIKGLIDRGHAYASDGDVYYRVRSFPDYGKLSHRSIDDLRAGARVDVGEAKHDPLDFALWKAAKPGEPSWESPWGAGRPGWHIECSAMCHHHLGENVDIHGGGADLIFPHHENEIAQSEAYLGREPFARYWVHNGLVQLHDEKMSKSLGNVVWIKDVLAKDRAGAFRVLVLQSHYRAPVTYSEQNLEAAEAGLSRLRSAASPCASEPTGDRDLALEALTTDAERRFHTAMRDDFDTASALAGIFDLGRAINRARGADDSAASTSVISAQTMLVELCDILGIDLRERTPAGTLDVAPFVELLIDVRQELRAAQQFALADSIRDRLTDAGVMLEDGPSGTTWKIDT